MKTARPAHLWDPLRRELEAWEAESATVRLWLRDDDATEVTPPLHRLLELCGAYGVPVLLAVIPAGLREELPEFVLPRADADVGVHGFAHANHAPPGAKAQEFPPGRDTVDVRRELRSGLGRLSEQFGARCLPLFVPPWNRISQHAALSLPEAGYRALSTFGWNRVLEPGSGSAELNTHVDIIDWRGNRGGRDHGWLAAELTNQLACAREAGHAPLGVLTHHLVHDEMAWRFLESLFTETARHGPIRWVSARELIAR